MPPPVGATVASVHRMLLLNKAIRIDCRAPERVGRRTRSAGKICTLIAEAPTCIDVVLMHCMIQCIIR
jgi:hypothetical protein